MNPTDPRPPEPKDLLADAIAAVRATCVDDALVDRCRRAALAHEGPSNPSASNHGRPSWLFPIAAAASVLLLGNLLQAYARLPLADRQRAAVSIAPDSRRFAVYSDLRLEPISSLDLDRLE